MPAGEWRWAVLDAQLNIVDHGTRGPWPPVVGDIHAVADEIMAEHAAKLLRDGRDLAELAGLVCRTWQGGAGFNPAGQPVDARGDVLEYGESLGDGWVKAA